MAWARSILIGFAVIAAAPARAPAQVALTRGETVTLRLDGGATAVVGPDRAGPLSDHDRAALELLLNGDYEAASGANALAITDRMGLPPAPPVEADAVRITFVSVRDGQHSLLIIENGYDRGLVYRAHIETAGGRAPTDVCLVMPRRRGHEHWPYPIDRIELSGFRLEPWDESQGLRCE